MDARNTLVKEAQAAFNAFYRDDDDVRSKGEFMADFVIAHREQHWRELAEELATAIGNMCRPGINPSASDRIKARAALAAYEDAKQEATHD